MTTYTKHLSEPWFSLIKIGAKKCEGRLNKGDFKEMKKGDFIIFENNDFGYKRIFKVKISSLRYYDTFTQYLTSEKLEKCLPGIDTLEQGANIYYKYYTREDERQYKIVALRLRVIA